MSTQGVTATDMLQQVIERLPPAEHDAVLNFIVERATELKGFYDQGSPMEFVQAYYEAFDETLAQVMARDSQPVSCRRGCHFCCRQNVTIWDAEAELIANYCKEKGIPISKAYLEQQLRYGWREVAQEDCARCVFLKDGECSIYPVRPLMCRKYHVVSPPELCDPVKYPASEGHTVAVSVHTLPEIEASAFAGVMVDKHKYGRLPEMLLPYSK